MLAYRGLCDDSESGDHLGDFGVQTRVETETGTTA
jgi:hypothetical protein